MTNDVKTGPILTIQFRSKRDIFDCTHKRWLLREKRTFCRTQRQRCLNGEKASRRKREIIQSFWSRKLGGFNWSNHIAYSKKGNKSWTVCVIGGRYRLHWKAWYFFFFGKYSPKKSWFRYRFFFNCQFFAKLYFKIRFLKIRL